VRGAVSGFCHGSAGRADTRHDHPGNSGEVRDGGWAVRLTAGDLETLGTFLFGPRWQSALARAIHYNPRQVRRSVAGETAVSIHATRLIEALALCRSLFRWQNEKDRPGRRLADVTNTDGRGRNFAANPVRVNSLV
jgi:hypothetical protein